MKWIERDNVSFEVYRAEPTKPALPVAVAARLGFQIGCPVCSWSRVVWVGFITKKLFYSEQEKRMMYAHPDVRRRIDKSISRMARLAVVCEECGTVGKLSPVDRDALLAEAGSLYLKRHFNHSLQLIGFVLDEVENACYFEPKMSYSTGPVRIPFKALRSSP